MAGYQLRDFTFLPTEEGGLEIVVRSHGTSRALHMSEDELFEMLAAVGLSADEVEDELEEDEDFQDYDEEDGD